MMELLIAPELRDGDEVLINPLMYSIALLKKVKRLIVYDSRLERYREAVARRHAFPVYLPELGVLVSLDVTSQDLAEWFYKEAIEYEGIISRGKVFSCTVHNFQPRENRMVSWGTVKSFELDDVILELYVRNLLNDFYITPSIVVGDAILSPHRWLIIPSESQHLQPDTLVSYNFGIVYIEKEELYGKTIIRKARVGSRPMRIYQVTGKFVYFQPDGFVSAKRVPLHFTVDPREPENLKISIEDKGDYFLCFAISFISRLTPRDGVSTGGDNINIVESLTELVYSPYEILPPLFPLTADKHALSNLVYRFDVKKSVYKEICSRLTKFGPPQRRELIEQFDAFAREQGLLSVTEQADSYRVELVNPAVVPFLIRRLASGRGEVRQILEEPRMLEKMKQLDEILQEYRRGQRLHATSLLPLSGIGEVLDRRAGVLRKYAETYTRIFASGQRASKHSRFPRPSGSAF